VIEDKDYVDHPAWVESATKYIEPACRAVKWVLDLVHPQINIIRIDRWDTWSMDHTLSYIILPMLKQLNEIKHGAPGTDDEDVPERLRSTAAEPKEDEWDIDSNHFLRWDWIMAEMIFAFECQLDDTWEEKYWTGEWGKPDFIKGEKEYPNPVTGEMESTYQINSGTRKCDWDGLKKEQERIANGFRLFGKYYQALWD
jgi:hypothetical protein